MAKIRPDFSFDREGRPLSAWLLDLVADDAPTRLKAGDVLQGMWFGVPYAHTELSDLEWEEHESRPGQSDRFAAAVRDATAMPGFPTADFARRLILYRMALHQDSRRRAEASCRRREEESDKYIERIGRRLEAAGDEAERAEAARRLCRWFCATVDRDLKANQAVHEGAEELSPAGMASHLVFEALDIALLADRPGLRLMLDPESGIRYAVLSALERIGPPAVDFAPELIAHLDGHADGSWSDATGALGSIGRDDPAVVDALITRLGSRSEAVRDLAAACLGRAGPPLAGRADEAVDLLLEAARGPGRCTMVEALASVGRNREDALAFVLEMASPKPPRWIHREYFPDDRADEVMFDRATAIVALRHFRGFADRVMPVLIEAIDSFEEYDPDYGYAGDHERASRTLAEFGPDAAAAVPRLVAYLDEWNRRPEDEQYPRAVLDALKAIGPAAASALPILEAIRLKHVEELGPDLDRHDPLDAAILAIRG